MTRLVNSLGLWLTTLQREGEYIYIYMYTCKHIHIQVYSSIHDVAFQTTQKRWRSKANAIMAYVNHAISLSVHLIEVSLGACVQPR